MYRGFRTCLCFALCFAYKTMMKNGKQQIYRCLHVVVAIFFLLLSTYISFEQGRRKKNGEMFAFCILNEERDRLCINSLLWIFRAYNKREGHI